MDAAGSDDYCTRIVHDLSEVGAAAWNSLVTRGSSGNPFLRFEFLHALHEAGCASPRTGWEPHYLTLWKSGVLAAAVPLYRKHHSYGEFVFDWAWAEAYQRHGLAYYPKLLTAVPYSPVPGPRLMVRSTDPRRSELRQKLVDLALAECERLQLSSWHCNFVLGPDAAACNVTRWRAPIGNSTDQLSQ
jgi:predicted N-acyltransferase